MRIALNLRHWINSVLSQMHDVHNWESSDRHAGAAHFEIPDFLFETSLEQVASVDYRTAMEIFGVIHRKDDATDEISHFIEFGDDDEPIDTWRGRTSQVWLQAIQIYDHISRQIGWSEHAVSDQDRAMMQGEVDDFQKRTQDRAKAHAHPSEDLDV
jgi:hypothetical protein